MWTYKIELKLMWIYKINQHLPQISTKIILQNATNSKKLDLTSKPKLRANLDENKKYK